MKKTLTVVALVLLISVSLIAGTLAAYQITIDELAKGSVVAKEFEILPGDTEYFENDLRLAPGETEAWTFTVSNGASEVDMELAFGVDFSLTDFGEDGAANLTYTLSRVNGESPLPRSTDGKYVDTLALAEESTTNSYELAVTWVEDGTPVDATVFAGEDLATVTLSLTATQKTDSPESGTEG